MKPFLSILFLSILVSSCATFRQFNDEEAARITGVRTMGSSACWSNNVCIEKAIVAAKKECNDEGKKYESVYHGGQIVKYRCL